MGLFGLAVCASSVLGGFQPAQETPTVTFTFRISFGFGNGVNFCLPYGYLDRGVIEGEGSGFIDDPAPELAEVLTVLDIAHRLLRGEQIDEQTGQAYTTESGRGYALEAYQMHQEDYPSDWYTMREHALVLLWDGQYEFGLAKLLQSYQGDPALARVGFDINLFGDGNQELMKLSQRLVRYAKSKNSGSAWFAVAVILQSQEKFEHAQLNLERAIEAGFDEPVALRMQHAIDEELGLIRVERADR